MMRRGYVVSTQYVWMPTWAKAVVGAFAFIIAVLVFAFDGGNFSSGVVAFAVAWLVLVRVVRWVSRS